MNRAQATQLVETALKGSFQQDPFLHYESVRDPKTGTINPEERLTPACRFSCLVGESESCHTLQTRFLGLLHRDDAPRLTPCMCIAIDDLVLDHLAVVYLGNHAHPLSGDITAMPPVALVKDPEGLLTGSSTSRSKQVSGRGNPRKPTRGTKNKAKRDPMQPRRTPSPNKGRH